MWKPRRSKASKAKGPASDVAAAVVVETDDTREAIAEALSRLNDQAKAERRRGKAGVYGSRYEALHLAMDPLIDGILFRDSWSTDLVARGTE